MIRSRDLILFVLVLLFLGIAIFATLFAKSGTPHVFEALVWEEGDEVAISAQTTNKDIDRTSIIDRLRAKIDQNQIIADSAAVLAEEPAVEENGTAEVQRCEGADDALALLRDYPTSGVSVALKEGARVVIHTQTENQLHATGTTQTVVQNTLLQLPVYPQKSVQTHCVPSAVIGVTANGSLLFNSDAAFYNTYASDALVGYARDGFPIYGAYTGETDVCGGYDHPNGYRYTVSKERPFILGCFAASAQSFVSL